MIQIHCDKNTPKTNVSMKKCSHQLYGFNKINTLIIIEKYVTSFYLLVYFINIITVLYQQIQ